MKSILVLVDFTPTADISIAQASELAKNDGSKVILCHVVKNEGEKANPEIREHMDAYGARLDNAGVKHEVLLSVGELFTGIADAVKASTPALVVVGTHGRVGMMQQLFGSKIYKLVKTAGTNVLVVNDHFYPSKGFKKVILPLSSHQDFMKKVESTISLLGEEGNITLLNINKTIDGLPEALEKNLRAAQTHLAVNNVSFDYVERTSKMASVGFAKETLQIAEELRADLISIMTQIGDVNTDAANLDKENVLLNTKGIAVLCTDDA